MLTSSGLDEPTGADAQRETLGEIRFMHRGRLVTARLNASGTWEANDAAVRALLNEVFVPSFTACEIHVPARHFLYQVAERLGGDVRCQRRDG